MSLIHNAFYSSLVMAFVLLSGPALTVKAQSSSPSPVLYGFTAFPYDLTHEAYDQVHEIILPNSNVYAIHLDQCVPWYALLNNKPLPRWISQDWAELRNRIPAGHAVYLAVTPTAMDRRSPAPPCSQTEGVNGYMPASIAAGPLDAPAVRTSYLKYVKRAIDTLQPDYVNIGIEISELALEHPGEWPAFERLYLNTLQGLRQSHPEVKVGLELVLQSLMLPRVAETVRAAVEASDYIGISFYPYSSNLGVAMGAPALPAGYDQWRWPLEWLRTYTNKPIAICETGYTTEGYVLPVGQGLSISGTEEDQRRYVKELIEIAKRHQYLFVIWFISVDYEPLLARIPNVSAIHLIWVNTGLFNSDLTPKPAWSEWLAGW